MIRRLTPGWRLRATWAALWWPPLLHLVSLTRLARWAGGRRTRPEAHEVDDPALAEWVDRVLDVLPWPWRRTCLKRGLAIFALLARAGRPAELRVGVRRDATGALVAHAWLVRGGVPILEPGIEPLDDLREISRFGPVGSLS